MACYHPLKAFQLEDGSVVFHERAGRGSVRSLFLPCGQCVGCRLERSRQWAVRCLHEASLYDVNSFVTLTYDDAHLPTDRSLQYRDFQLFMKRLRKVRGNVRFYMCGEYGGQTARPHYHACLFNVDFPDKLYFKKSRDGSLYTSGELSRLWPDGFSTVGAVTFESAAYAARYCVEKITGQEAFAHYAVTDVETGEVVASRVPEFNRMSLKPGVGIPWLRRYWSDVFPTGEVVSRGRLCRSPRAYDRYFKREDVDDGYARMLMRREEFASRYPNEQSEERLAVREAVAKARLALNVRTLEE